MQAMPDYRGRRGRQIEALDHFLGLALIAGFENGSPGRLTDQRVAHVREPLACEAELDVVLAALTGVEFGLGAHLWATKACGATHHSRVA